MLICYIPVIIDAEDFEQWLSPQIDGHKLVRLLRPHDVQGFEAFPINTAVNKLANNDPALDRKNKCSRRFQIDQFEGILPK